MATTTTDEEGGGGGKMMMVWDFDGTIIRGKCDHWVMLEMGLTKLFQDLRKTFIWNSLMDRMMEELHALGKTTDDFIDRLNKFTLHPQMISAIKSAHDLGCEMKVLSNANQFFIETILRNNGVLDCFSGIISNPTVVDEKGRLRIFPYHGVDLPPHGCKFCPANLCKGIAIDQIRESDVKKRRIIYVGDGKDDLCPCLKLGEEDHAMPSSKSTLYYLLTLAKKVRIRPTIQDWKDGEQLQHNLVRLLSPQDDTMNQ